jgi:hypothetical protein
MKSSPLLQTGSFDIVVAIPTHCEAGTLAATIRTLAEEIPSCTPNQSVAFVLCDNDSPDGTRKVFEQISTPGIEKFILTNAKPGKGNNLRSALKIARNVRPATLLVFPSIGTRLKGWPRALLQAMQNGHDLVLPAYTYHPYFAPFSQHLAIPLLYTLGGWLFSQPLAGICAMSPELAEACLSRKWDESDRGHGVNMLIPITAIERGFSVLQMQGPKSEPMAEVPYPSETVFADLTATLFCRATPDERGSAITSDCRLAPPATQPGLFDYKAIKTLAQDQFRKNRERIQSVLAGELAWRMTQQFDQGRIDVNMSRWQKILASFYRAARKSADPLQETRALYPLFLGRLMTFYRNSLELSISDCQRLLEAQRMNFKMKRDLFFEDPNALPPEKRPWFREIRAAVL